MTARAGTRERPRAANLVAAAALFALFPIAILIVHAPAWWPAPICLFRLATGLPCPLCGMTHAFAEAAGGRFAAAFEWHPLWPLFAGLVLATALLFLVDAVARGDRAMRFLASARRGWPALLVLLVIFGVIRWIRL